MSTSGLVSLWKTACSPSWSVYAPSGQTSTRCLYLGEVGSFTPHLESLAVLLHETEGPIHRLVTVKVYRKDGAPHLRSKKYAIVPGWDQVRLMNTSFPSPVLASSPSGKEETLVGTLIRSGEVSIQMGALWQNGDGDRRWTMEPTSRLPRRRAIIPCHMEQGDVDGLEMAIRDFRKYAAAPLQL